MESDWEQDFTEVWRVWGFHEKLLVIVSSQILKNVFIFLPWYCLALEELWSELHLCLLFHCDLLG